MLNQDVPTGIRVHPPSIQDMFLLLQSGGPSSRRSQATAGMMQAVCITSSLYAEVEMTQLIGRARELRDLQHAWEAAQRAEPQLVVLWGRRRVGKTFLLTALRRRERHVYFTATRQGSNRRQVDRFALAAVSWLGGVRRRAVGRRVPGQSWYFPRVA